MAVIKPQNAGIPTHINGLFKPPPVYQNPFHIPNALGQDITNPHAIHTGATAVTPPPAPVAPPPPDFNALTLTDPQYVTGSADLQRQNQLSLDQMLKGYLGASQGHQDSANAHGALFSGAAVHAQNYAGQQYADQQAQQAQNLLGGQHALYSNTFNRLMQQLAGGS